MLVDIPMDVQRAEIDAAARPAPPCASRRPVDPGDVAEVLDRLGAAERPLILAGGGVRASGAVAAFRAFVRRRGCRSSTR